MNDGAEDRIRVLHVDDDQDMGSLVAMQLERQSESISVISEQSADDGLTRLAENDVDCVVSDHDMPGKNGLEFLRDVRESHPELPFVLFTGKGSEEIASDAISAGVTEYLEKGTGSDQYAVLANRIERAVSANRAERALEESERRLSTLISNLPGMVYRCRNERGWPMTFVSEGAHELTGYPAAAIESGDACWEEEVLVEDDREAMWEQVQAAVDANEPFEVTYRIEAADGEVRWMWERGRVVDLEGDSEVIEGFITDITARRERERELRAEREFTENVLNSLEDAFFVIGEDGNLVRWNDRVNEVTGYTDDEIAAMDVGEFFTETDRDDLVDAFCRAYDGDGVRVEGTVETKDGNEVPYEFRGTAFHDGDGETIGVSGVGREISERKNRERELEEFASVVSHDLRNPLNVVQGRVQLALETGEVENLDAALDAAERIERLSDDVVRLARPGRDRDSVGPVAIADVATDAWDRSATDGSSITVDTSQTVDGDPDRIGELFEQLFENAVQHGAGEDDSVTVRVGDIDDGFFVEDDGAGIESDRCDSVFDRGYATSGNETGFGLAIVENITSAHDWSISATESEAGDDPDSPGARFEIQF